MPILGLRSFSSPVKSPATVVVTAAPQNNHNHPHRLSASTASVEVTLDDDDELFFDAAAEEQAPLSSPLRMQLLQAQQDAKAINVSNANLMERMKSLREKKNALLQHRKSLSSNDLRLGDGGSATMESSSSSPPPPPKTQTPPPPRRSRFSPRFSRKQQPSQKQVRFNPELTLQSTATTSTDEGEELISVTVTKQALPLSPSSSSSDHDVPSSPSVYDYLSPLRNSSISNSSKKKRTQTIKQRRLPKVWTVGYFLQSVGISTEKDVKSSGSMAGNDESENSDGNGSVDNAVAWKLQRQAESSMDARSTDNLAALSAQLHTPSRSPLPPVGRHALQLYNHAATPNGQQVTILLEELLAAGIHDADYDAWLVDARQAVGPEFGRQVNPTASLPALLDYGPAAPQPFDFLPWNNNHNNNNHHQSTRNPKRIFESGSILLYLVQERFPNSPMLPRHQATERTKVLNWLCWQMAATAKIGTDLGGFGYCWYHHERLGDDADPLALHMMHHATIEIKRQLHILNQLLEENAYVAGKDYSIADIALFPWYGQLVLGHLYGSACNDFLNVDAEYVNVQRWAKDVARRPAVRRGLIVNRVGPGEEEERCGQERLGSGPFLPGAPQWATLRQPGDSKKGVRRKPARQAHLCERHMAADIDEALEAFVEAKSF